MYADVEGVQEGYRTMLCVFTHKDSSRLITEQSRYGRVVRLLGPCSLTYHEPCYRVLQSDIRNANPWFHLYEALWMLTGRNDVASLARFVKFVSTFSDNGKTFHAAYGHRWRSHFGGDQLKAIIRELKANPSTRRCYLNMWDPQEDLYGFEYDNTPLADDHTPYDRPLPALKVPNSKDFPCNVGCVFQSAVVPTKDGNGEERILNLTVFNRSNDLFWGMLGSNYVTFSILLEYVAAMTNISVGYYSHITSNVHYYTDNFSPEKVQNMHDEDNYDFNSDNCPLTPLVTDPVRFDVDVESFVADPFASHHYASPQQFIQLVAAPMMSAWKAHKEKDDKLAIGYASDIVQPDWRQACLDWLLNYRARKQRQSYQSN